MTNEARISARLDALKQSPRKRGTARSHACPRAGEDILQGSEPYSMERKPVKPPMPPDANRAAVPTITGAISQPRRSR